MSCDFRGGFGSLAPVLLKALMYALCSSGNGQQSTVMLRFEADAINSQKEGTKLLPAPSPSRCFRCFLASIPSHHLQSTKKKFSLLDPSFERSVSMVSRLGGIGSLMSRLGKVWCQEQPMDQVQPIQSVSVPRLDGPQELSPTVG